MIFSTVVGQEDIKQTLAKQINNSEFPHAQFFLGDEGYGSLACAIAYVKYLFCLNRENNDACNNCSACTKISNLSHPDLHYVYPSPSESVVNKGKKGVLESNWKSIAKEKEYYFNIENWKDKLDLENKQISILRKQVDELVKTIQLRSFESSFKAAIIWHPELMNPSSANTLLKTLEEPSGKTLLILVSDTTQRILPTILSRVQLIQFHKPSNDSVKGYATQKLMVSPEDAATLAKESRNNIINLNWKYNQDSAPLEYLDLFKQLMRLAYKADISELLKWSESISIKGKEFQKSFINYIGYFVRESLVNNYCFNSDEIDQASLDEKEFLNKFAMFIHSQNCTDILKLVENSYRALLSNVSSKLVFTNLVLKITKFIKVKVNVEFNK